MLCSCQGLGGLSQEGLSIALEEKQALGGEVLAKCSSWLLPLGLGPALCTWYVAADSTGCLTFQAFRATLLIALPLFCFQLMQVTGADVPGKRHLVKFNAAAALGLCKTANRSIRLYGDNLKYFERS